MMCARFFCLDLCLVFLVTEYATLFERKSCRHVCSMERIEGVEHHFERPLRSGGDIHHFERPEPNPAPQRLQAARPGTTQRI